MKIFSLLSSIALAGALAVSPAALCANQQNKAQFTPEQTQAIQKITHDYLVDNPQVLVEVSQALQKQELAKAEQKAETAIAANAKEIFNSPTSPVIGNAKGDVTLVEFYDYQCPHCKQMAPIVMKVMKDNPQLRIVFKELPIFGGNSREASMASLAAYKQGTDKFIKFHDGLMAAANPLTPDKIMNIAKSSGLNTDQLKKDMKDPTVAAELKANFALAQKLSIMGTPSFIFGNKQADQKGNSVFIPGATTEAKLLAAIAKLQ